MLQEVYLEHHQREQFLHGVDHEGTLVLLLHLKWIEPLEQDHKSYPRVRVVVVTDEQCQSYLSKLLPPSVDETEPHEI